MVLGQCLQHDKHYVFVKEIVPVLVFQFRVRLWGWDLGTAYQHVTIECADIKCCIVLGESTSFEMVVPVTLFLVSNSLSLMPTTVHLPSSCSSGQKVYVVEQTWVWESDLFQTTQLCASNLTSLSFSWFNFKMVKSAELEKSWNKVVEV